MRRWLFCLLGISTGASSFAVPLPPLTFADDRNANPPNVILIVSDDIGYADLGFQGGKDIPTPYLDSIAKNGVRFTNGYVTGSTCGPTRAGLISGRYQQRHSSDTNPAFNSGLNLKETTIAQALTSSGYTSGGIGKWHLGAQPEYRPESRGFAQFFGFYGAMHSYVPGEVSPESRMIVENPRRSVATNGRDGSSSVPRTDPTPQRENNPSTGAAVGFSQGGNRPSLPGSAPGKIIRGLEEVDEPDYLTDAFSREAVAFIEQNQGKPYFLYAAFNAAHSPLQPTPKYLDRFPNLTGKRQAYAATISALDDAVGALLHQVESLGQLDNTLIIYINDNGGAVRDIAADNGPLGGAKFSLWEGGIRVPFAIQWKGKIPAGVVIDTAVSSLDIYPTVLAATNAKIPDDKKLDGTNLIPFLLGEKPLDELQDRPLFWRTGENWAVRKGDWKLTKPERGEETQLFNLKEDIGENKDLSKDREDLAQELHTIWEQWNTENLPLTANR